MLYRQISSERSLEALPPESVVMFDGLVAVKSRAGNWLVSGEHTPLSSNVLHNMSPVFHVLAEYTFYPSEGYNSARVNLKHVLQLIERYEEVPWVVVFEWIRDFYGVSLEVAHGAVEALIKKNMIEPASEDTIRVKPSV